MPSAHHEITEELGDDEIAARLAALGSPAVVDRTAPQALDIGTVESYDDVAPRYYKPLVDAADEYQRFAKRPNERIYTGIAELDRAMRGLAPGELMNVLGYAHSGKTVLVTEMLLHNRDKRIAYFTPDETRVLMLVKLVAVVHGVSAETLEQRLAKDDPEAIDMLRSTATERFPHLAVWDDVSDLGTMGRCLDEVEQLWGGRTQLLVFDYLELLSDVEDVRAKWNAIKAFGKERRIPCVVLHQTSKTLGGDGKQVTIDSGAYGGQQQSTFMVGVRRKRAELWAQARELREKINNSSGDTSKYHSKLSDVEYEIRKHQHTITINVVKNKRPPSKLVDDIDFHLDEETGRIRPLDMPTVAKRVRASDVLKRSHSPLPIPEVDDHEVPSWQRSDEEPF